jgi:hypothetical protein
MTKIKYYGLESHFNENVTFYKDVNIQGNLNYDSLTVRNLTVSEQSTLGVTTSTSLSAQNLSVSGIITGNLIGNVTGIVTASTITATDSITLTTKPFFRNVPTIAADYTVTTDYNEMSIGPITINNGITVTVNSGATWTVV